MKLRHAVLIGAVVFACGFFFSSQVRPEASTAVKSIDTVELDRLIKDKDCQCLIVAMASWCGACREELPTLIKLYDKYKGQGLKIIGVSLDLEGPSAIQRIVDGMNVNFPFYWVGDKAVSEYNISAIPMLFLVKNGEIVEKIVGKRSESFLDKKIGNFLQ